MKQLWVFLLAAIACAQQLDLSSLDKLASKASESSTVNLDAPKLKIASQFLSSDDPSHGNVKNLITGLRGISVRSFEFDSEGAYRMSDLDPIRNQLKAPGWSNIVNVKDRNESAEVWLFTKGDVLDGIAIIAAEPDEVTVVNIVGSIDINSLSKLSGSFGIPDIDTDMLDIRKKPAPKPSPSKPAQPKREKNDDE
jgi:hypothetical protein